MERIRTNHKYMVRLEKRKKEFKRIYQRAMNNQPFLLRFRNNYKKMHGRNKDMTTRKRNRSAAIGVRVIKIL